MPKKTKPPRRIMNDSLGIAVGYKSILVMGSALENGGTRMLFPQPLESGPSKRECDNHRGRGSGFVHQT